MKFIFSLSLPVATSFVGCSWIFPALPMTLVVNFCVIVINFASLCALTYNAIRDQCFLLLMRTSAIVKSLLFCLNTASRTSIVYEV